MLHVCIQHDMFAAQKGQLRSCLWQRRPIQERFTTCKTCQVLASDTVFGIMLNDVVAEYKKWIKWSFMSLTGLAYNRVIECEAKVNLHDDDRRVINWNWGFFWKMVICVCLSGSLFTLLFYTSQVLNSHSFKNKLNFWRHLWNGIHWEIGSGSTSKFISTKHILRKAITVEKYLFLLVPFYKYWE